MSFIKKYWWVILIAMYLFNIFGVKTLVNGLFAGNKGSETPPPVQ